MKNIKSVMKQNGGSTRAPEYVQRVALTPIHMTTNREAGTSHGQIHGRRRCHIPVKLALHPGVGVRTG